MNVIAHALMGWALASAAPALSRAQKGWIVAASVAPDLDGLGILAEAATRSSERPLYWWSEYHHVVAHNLATAVLLAALSWLPTRRPRVALLVFGAIHLHLVGDLCGSRAPDGYQWPIRYLWPFSDALELVVPWQWQLDAWPNVLIGVLLLAYTLWLAWRSGSSPLELVSRRGNDVLVAALRARFAVSRGKPVHAGAADGGPSGSGGGGPGAV